MKNEKTIVPYDSQSKDKKCFVISPIEKADSEVRIHADKFFNYIAKSIESKGYEVNRSDTIEHSGQITDLIVKSIYEADIIIADLTYNNPNVYYELAFAHALRKNTILFKSDNTPIPFDNMNMITTHYDHNFEFGSIEKTKDILFEKIKNDDYSNPIISGLNRLKIDLNKDFEKTTSSSDSITKDILYELLNKMDELERSVNYVEKQREEMIKNKISRDNRNRNLIELECFEKSSELKYMINILELEKDQLILIKNKEEDKTRIQLLNEWINNMDLNIRHYKEILKRNEIKNQI
ncbi:MAG: hypothetical protein KRP56_06385 [Candidatus Methanogranum gryphiswaldense]|nr:MAG: hypothetical protein KRP56_06385 [Candidatus Methanogranum sp. U3.2.1]